MSNQKTPGIRQPSHNSITLSHGEAFVSTELAGGNEPKPFVRVTGQRLDANDAIRLAAFLNRFYIEQGQAEQKAEASAVARRQAARAARQAAVRAVK